MIPSPRSSREKEPRGRPGTGGRISLWRHLRPGQRVLIGLAVMWLALGLGLAFVSLVVVGETVGRDELLLLSAPFAVGLLVTVGVGVARREDLRTMHVAGRRARRRAAGQAHRTDRRDPRRPDGH